MIDKIVMGFGKEGIEMGHNMRNEILDFSFNLYKKLKD